MTKKNLTITTAALVLTLAFAAMASAYGNRGFSQAYDQLTPEKQQVVRDIFDKHSDSLTAIKNNMWAKQVELDALTKSGTATKSDITGLVDELSALRLKMQTERDAMFNEVQDATGIEFQPGYGGNGGYGDCPRNGRGGGNYGGNGGCSGGGSGCNRF